MDANDRIKQLVAHAKALIKPYEAIARLKPGKDDSALKLEKMVDTLPSGPTLAQAADDIKREAREITESMRRARVEGMGKSIAAFIGEQRSKNVPLREANKAWRIGPLELQFRQETAEARVCYNRIQIEPTKGWASIDGKDHIDQLYQAALGKLKQADIPEDLLLEAMWDAYVTLRDERSQSGSGRPNDVPLRDMHAELRVALVRGQLRRRKGDAKLSHTEMPNWAYLYALDRYRKLAGTLPDSRRLSFVTGSQAEQAKSGGCVLGGLDPLQTYKTFCSVRPVNTEPTHG